MIQKSYVKFGPDFRLRCELGDLLARQWGRCFQFDVVSTDDDVANTQSMKL